MNIDPDTIIRPLAFDWGEVVGPSADPPFPPDIPKHVMPPSPTDMTVGVGKDNTVLTATKTLPQPVPFKLWDRYPVDGGIIANGTVRFGFTTPEGVVVTCTYRGGSSTAAPTDPDELIKGQQLSFVTCTDGLPPDAPRRGTRFVLEVVPAPGYPVTVRSPTTEDTGCSDEMQLLSADETRQMRRAFRWDQRPVVARNPDGFFALYYAWVYIRNKDEALALRKLLIHVLTRPLFNEELDRLAGKCGALTNPGDGDGQFVPVLIPGAVYNKLIDALTSPDVRGDRVIFDAVIIRPVPAAARNANGSIRLDLLAQSGFRYLHYEPKPLIGFRNMQLEGGVSKVITDALEWVATAAKDVGEFFTNRLGDLDRLVRGSVFLTLNMHALTRDPSFAASPVMVRGWGPAAGRPLGAQGLQVTALQKLFDSPIPTTSMGNTNPNGRVVIKAVEDAAPRGSGLCMELKTAGAMVTDFLIATEICDLRGLAPAGAVPPSFRLTDFSRNQSMQFEIDNVRVMGIYQADDVAQWNRSVGRFSTKRARILSGYWATTFSPDRRDGAKRLYAPCLNFANSLSDTFLAASLGVGILSQLIVPVPIIPIVLTVFTSVVTNSDIVMSPRSNLPNSREVLSHEYGHFTFCALMQAANPNAVSHVIWDTIAAGDDQRDPLRAFNEAFADFITGQVAGGLDYNWSAAALNGTYCVPATQPCWDENQHTNATAEDGAETIGRFATLLQDLFDGHNARGQFLPGDGDVWQPIPMTMPASLEVSPTGFGDRDPHLERVHLDGTFLRDLAFHLSRNLFDFGTGDTITHQRVFSAVNDTMADANTSWCDRCRVLALHSTNYSDTPGNNNVAALWSICANDPLLRQALGTSPDHPFRRLDADTCTVCPPGTTSDANGVCQSCNGQVHGNSCDTCIPDVILDGATMALGTSSFATTFSATGDLCPEMLLVDVRNPQAVFGRGAVSLSGNLQIDPRDRQRCERRFDLMMDRENAAGSFVPDIVIGSSGTWVTRGCTPGSPFCLELCEGLPAVNLTATQVSMSTLRFRTPAHPNNLLQVVAARQIE